MSDDLTFTCPDCGGEDVEQLLTVWRNPNTGQDGDGSFELADAYGDKYYCNDCRRHPSHLVERRSAA